MHVDCLRFGNLEWCGSNHTCEAGKSDKRQGLLGAERHCQKSGDWREILRWVDGRRLLGRNLYKVKMLKDDLRLLLCEKERRGEE